MFARGALCQGVTQPQLPTGIFYLEVGDQGGPGLDGGRGGSISSKARRCFFLLLPFFKTKKKKNAGLFVSFQVLFAKRRRPKFTR